MKFNNKSIISLVAVAVVVIAAIFYYQSNTDKYALKDWFNEPVLIVSLSLLVLLV